MGSPGGIFSPQTDTSATAAPTSTQTGAAAGGAPKNSVVSAGGAGVNISKVQIKTKGKSKQKGTAATGSTSGAVPAISVSEVVTNADADVANNALATGLAYAQQFIAASKQLEQDAFATVLGTVQTSAALTSQAQQQSTDLANTAADQAASVTEAATNAPITVPQTLSGSEKQNIAVLVVIAIVAAVLFWR